MITLYDFKTEGAVGSASPFVLKIETFFRLAGLPYEKKRIALPVGAPKKKLPYIDDDGETVCDSAFIIAHVGRKHGIDLDASLPARALAISHAFRKMTEESTYWTTVYARWIDEANWPKTRRVFFAKIPPPLKWIGPNAARKAVRASLDGHGYGRHTQDEVYDIALQDVRAVEGQLAEAPYLMGSTATAVDASIFGLYAQLAYGGIDSPHADYVRSSRPLMAYCDRIRERCFE